MPARTRGLGARATGLTLLALAALARPVAAFADGGRAEPTWRERYERARTMVVQQRYAEAEAALNALAAIAADETDRRIAAELAAVARAVAERKAREEARRPEVRTGDEMSALYTTAVLYGLGTSGWVTLQLKPQSLGGALLPFVLITPASVGAIAIADRYRPFGHGVPHAIAAGAYLGLGECIWVAGYQRERARRTGASKAWGAETVSTALWASSTAGAAAGGFLGAWRRPTPGRVSFTASAAIWGGAVPALAASALEARTGRRGETAYLAGAFGSGVGLVGGVLLGPRIAPSVARVRFLDLGGVGGMLLGVGTYALVAGEGGTRGAMAAAAAGGTLGVALTWWATSGMPADHSHDGLRPLWGGAKAALSAVRPALVPTPGGFTASLVGEL
jgi:hypothetical protein